MTTRVVTRLQIQAPFKRLAIRNSGFPFDPGTPRGWLLAPDLRIPGPKVALDAERHLGPPSQGGVESGPQSLEECQLGPVPQRIAGRIGSKYEVETNDPAVSGKKREIGKRNLAPLEPADTRMGRVGRTTDFGLTEPGTDPGESPVIGHPTHGRPAAPPRAIRHSFSRRHRRRSWHLPLCWRFTAVTGTLSVPTGEAARPRQAVHGFRPSVGTPSDPIDVRTSEPGGQRHPRSLVGTPDVQSAEREAQRP